jgi:hypothetical protein
MNPSPSPSNSETALDPTRQEEAQVSPSRWKRFYARLGQYWLLLALLTLVIGLASGYQLGKQAPAVSGADQAASQPGENKTHAMLAQINPPEGYTLPVKFGMVGPELLAAGAIHYEQFVGLYEKAGQPLTEAQVGILTEGSDAQVKITRETAYFLLNFFWALGLTNQNPILVEGPLMAGGKEKIGGFASTGGWTIGRKSPVELYASTPIIHLNQDQQKRLEEVASAVYRPCCNNPTHAPDCNHGMAMLGLLELMASQEASIDEMFAAAKYVNAFWFPQQTLEIATLFQANNQLEFAQVDARRVVGKEYASASGFQAVHRWLAANGLLEQAPESGGGCGV